MRKILILFIVLIGIVYARPEIAQDQFATGVTAKIGNNWFQFRVENVQILTANNVLSVNITECGNLDQLFIPAVDTSAGTITTAGIKYLAPGGRVISSNVFNIGTRIYPYVSEHWRIEIYNNTSVNIRITCDIKGDAINKDVDIANIPSVTISNIPSVNIENEPNININDRPLTIITYNMTTTFPSSVQILTANMDRRYLNVVNNGSISMNLGLGADAVIGHGISLGPNGGNYEMFGENLYLGKITGISNITQNVGWTEGE